MHATDLLERCDRPFGTLALIGDGNSQWRYALAADYQVSSVNSFLRVLVQQSKCFELVEPAVAARTSVLRKKARTAVKPAAMADYIATASFSLQAGVAASVSTTLDSGAGIVEALRASQVSAVIRTTTGPGSVELETAWGGPGRWDSHTVRALLGERRADGSGLGETPEGTLVAAAVADSYNSMVRLVREHQARQALEVGEHGAQAATGAKRSR